MVPIYIPITDEDIWLKFIKENLFRECGTQSYIDSKSVLKKEQVAFSIK